MSLFQPCEACEEIAEVACLCESPPRLFCNNHLVQHMELGGSHSIQGTSIALSDQNISAIQRSIGKHKHQCIRQAVSRKNFIVERCLEQIKKTEEACSEFIEYVLGGKTENILIEIVNRKSLPLFCENPLVLSLISLEKSSQFYEKNILQETQSYVQSLNLSLIELSQFRTYPKSIDDEISMQQEDYSSLLREYQELHENLQKESNYYTEDKDEFLKECKEQEEKYKKQISKQQENNYILILNNQKIENTLKKENIQTRKMQEELIKQNDELKNKYDLLLRDFRFIKTKKEVYEENISKIESIQYIYQSPSRFWGTFQSTDAEKLRELAYELVQLKKSACNS